MRISIIGAGNGGQAMAGHFAMLGHQVVLYNRSLQKLSDIIRNRGILLKEAINGFGKLSAVTDNLEEAVTSAELIMVTTTADAHKSLAAQMAGFLQDGQIVVLNPGRTFGALEYHNQLKKHTNKDVIVAEAQSLIYACRTEGNGEVRVIGVKDKILFSAYPSRNTARALDCVNSVFNCFIPVENVLHTGLENIGAIFHPSVVIFNAAAIERGNEFYFYNDMTPTIAGFLQQVDRERIAVGKAFGIELIPVDEWVSYAYPNVSGNDLCEKMRNNPSYYKILAPQKINSRLITEDVPTGLVPISQLGDFVGVETNLIKSVVNICCHLVGINFWETGRNIDILGMKGKEVHQFIEEL